MLNVSAKQQTIYCVDCRKACEAIFSGCRLPALFIIASPVRSRLLQFSREYLIDSFNRCYASRHDVTSWEPLINKKTAQTNQPNGSKISIKIRKLSKIVKGWPDKLHTNRISHCLNTNRPQTNGSIWYFLSGSCARSYFILWQLSFHFTHTHTHSVTCASIHTKTQTRAGTSSVDEFRHKSHAISKQSFGLSNEDEDICNWFFFSF